MTYKKKLIEVGLPLDSINQGSKPETENPFLRNHPRSIHNWWARTPLSVSRAILFAQVIDDPASDKKTPYTLKKRKELINFISRLATWEATLDESTLNEAKNIIKKQFNGEVPEFWDPFAGRGSIPLEAQRLGFKVTSSDLNPVAVLIQKGLLEIPQKLKRQEPLNPRNFREGITSNNIIDILETDLKYYASQMREKVEKDCGRYFTLNTPSSKKNSYKSLAFLWCRTVESPNPALKRIHVPLISTFLLSNKKGRLTYLNPIINKRDFTCNFEISTEPKCDLEKIKKGTRANKKATFNCLFSDVPITNDYIRKEGQAGRIRYRLLAILIESNGKKYFIESNETLEKNALDITEENAPNEQLAENSRYMAPPLYGLKNFSDLFLPRQAKVLVYYTNLIKDIYNDVLKKSSGDIEYAKAIALYLGFAVSRMTDYVNTLTTWNPTNENTGHLFQRQAIPMVWDFVEINPISGPINIEIATEWICSSLRSILIHQIPARVVQHNAMDNNLSFSLHPIISTDPPYYDNIGYSDISDFFYVWLRKTLKEIFPQELSTILTPKESELVAVNSKKSGNQAEQKKDFQDKFLEVFRNLHKVSRNDIPITIYYAFLQEEGKSSENERYSTGWETMLQSMIDAGFQVTGTWPIRTSKAARSVALGTNALASTIILVCRKNEVSLKSNTITKKDFIRLLKDELTNTIKEFQELNLAPVDLPQACIGPGIAIYSSYKEILEPEGTKVSVKTALKLINSILDEVISKQDEDYDPDTKFAITWFQQYGINEGPYGDAEKVALTRNISVDGVEDSGIIKAKAGKVRLLKREELLPTWDPSTDKRLTVWEMTQYLIRELQLNGESGAASLLLRLGSKGDLARELAYRMHGLSKQKNLNEEAVAYNSLITEWDSIAQLGNELQNTQQIKLLHV